jgi:hypothetical protein
MTGKCPECGKDVVCARDGYSEPFFLFMPMHWAVPTDGREVALADNVAIYMPDLWWILQGVGPGIPVLYGACAYRFTDRKTPKAPSGRVERMPWSIFKLWGYSFKEPANYRERRDSDKKSVVGLLASRRM